MLLSLHVALSHSLQRMSLPLLVQRRGAGYLGLQGVSAQAMAGPGHHAGARETALPDQEAFWHHNARGAVFCCKVAYASLRCCAEFWCDRTHASAVLRKALPGAERLSRPDVMSMQTSQLALQMTRDD